MTVNELVQKIKDEKMCAFRYEIDGHQHYRDRFTIYIDGRMYFERFCWGEAAGLVYDAWASSVKDDGEIVWDTKTFYEGFLPKLPKNITKCEPEQLEVDAGYYKWPLDEKLKTDKKHGYGMLKMMFMKK